ncbi:hypothetical protein I79_006935 [Cricetulus griseus]|uniref:Uncharacterized protein n=1 Tax=Cricetulus griseus TaxID=10029 RepID=G3H970_CRIGR|nr:hypothetical protein I79_006935 [Cricetulus griseus]
MVDLQKFPFETSVCINTSHLGVNAAGPSSPSFISEASLFSRTQCDWFTSGPCPIKCSQCGHSQLHFINASKDIAKGTAFMQGKIKMPSKHFILL